MEKSIRLVIKAVRPLEMHPFYIEDWECSDKVIVPISFGKSMARAKIRHSLVKLQSMRFR